MVKLCPQVCSDAAETFQYCVTDSHLCDKISGLHEGGAHRDKSAAVCVYCRHLDAVMDYIISSYPRISTSVCDFTRFDPRRNFSAQLNEAFRKFEEENDACEARREREREMLRDSSDDRQGGDDCGTCSCFWFSFVSFIFHSFAADDISPSPPPQREREKESEREIAPSSPLSLVGSETGEVDAGERVRLAERAVLKARLASAEADLVDARVDLERIAGDRRNELLNDNNPLHTGGLFKFGFVAYKKGTDSFAAHEEARSRVAACEQDVFEIRRSLEAAPSVGSGLSEWVSAVRVSSSDVSADKKRKRGGQTGSHVFRTYNQKRRIIMFYANQGEEATRNFYNVGRQLVNRWRKEYDTLSSIAPHERFAARAKTAFRTTTHGRRASASTPSFDALVYNMFRHLRGVGLAVTATRFAVVLSDTVKSHLAGSDTLPESIVLPTVTRGHLRGRVKQEYDMQWVLRFFTRYGVRRFRISKYRKDISMNAEARARIEDAMREFDVSPDDVYNMDETAVFFEMHGCVLLLPLACCL